MARPRKKGLDYFPKDVDSWDDYKIMELLNEYGPLGYCIYDIARDEVYKNGYCLEVSLNMLSALIVRKIGNRWVEDKSLVIQIIQYCADIGLFDKDLLSQSVLTSVGIQRRYDMVTARSKIDKTKYWLLEKEQTPGESASETGVSAAKTPVNVTQAGVSAAKTPVNVTQAGVSAAKTPVNVTETAVSAAKSTQIKENKSKENEKKVNETKANEREAASPPAHTPDVQEYHYVDNYVDNRANKRHTPASTFPPTIDEVDEYIRNRGYHFSGERFCNYYSSINWKRGKSPIANWKLIADDWETRETASAPAAQTPAAQYVSSFDVDDLYGLSRFDD